jgi:hypothetical protein
LLKKRIGGTAEFSPEKLWLAPIYALLGSNQENMAEDIQGGSQQHQPPSESAQIYGTGRWP